MLDTKRIRADFPMLKQTRLINGHPLVYFDNAATTFKPQVVIDEVVNYYQDLSTNAHRGDYELSYQVSKEYEESRAVVANFINADPNCIVFTSGASMSLNLVAYGYGQKFLKPGDVVLLSEAEHASNILPWFKATEVTGAVIEYIPLDEEGRLTIENFKKVLHDKVKVVSIANVTNVLGFIAPTKEIAALAHQVGAILVVDSAQGSAHMKTDVKGDDVDFLAFSGHKICGPTGVGILYGKKELLEITDPFMMGGGSNARFDICGNILLKNPPYKFEAGTPAIEAVLGMAKAIEYVSEIGMDNIRNHETELRKYLMERLSSLDNLTIYNPKADTGIITFNVKGVFAQDAAAYLNKKGICVRAGNHCAKILLDFLTTSETLRCSLYFYNTKEEADRFYEVLKTTTLENSVDVLFED